MFRKFILKNENMNGWKDSNHEQWQIHVPSVIDTSIKYINQNTEISASVTQACYLIRISCCWVCARKMELQCLCSGPLFTEQWDVLLPNLMKFRSREIGCYNAHTVGTPYNTNVGVQKIPDRVIWKPVVAKRNNTNPWSCSEPQILVTRDSRQVHMVEQPASRDRLE